METINVPDIEDRPTSQLCWQQCVPTAENPAPEHVMARCDRRAGHLGRHTWEPDDSKFIALCSALKKILPADVQLALVMAFGKEQP